MSTSDFAAAQARIAARRATRERHHTTHVSSPSTSLSPSTLHPSLDRLPFGLRTFAQSSIDFYTTLRSSTGTRPAFRVGQVDAELLDQELLGLLKTQVSDGLKYLGAHFSDDWDAEISAVLSAVLWKLSIWDQSASYGASLQGLRYIDSRAGGRGRRRSETTHRDPSRWQKAGHGILTVAGSYGWQKWESWLLRQSEEHDRPNNHHDTSQRNLERLEGVTKWLGTTHQVASLISFLAFLYNGRYRTLTDRVLGLRLAPAARADTTRQVSFEYLNRQLVWHAFTEFLLFVLPLVGVSRWKRILGRAWQQLKRIISLGRLGASDQKGDISPDQGQFSFLPERTCAICYKDQTVDAASEADVLAQSSGGGVVGSAQTDITNPYEAIPCGCVYCFVCLAHAIEAAEGHGWTCLRCAEPSVVECRPWSGDIVEDILPEPDDKRMSRKSVVFADDETVTSDGERDEKGRRRLSAVDPMPMDHHDPDVKESEDHQGSDTSEVSPSEGSDGEEEEDGSDVTGDEHDDLKYYEEE